MVSNLPLRTLIKEAAEMKLAIFLFFMLAIPAFADEPPVKKSKNDICHPKNGQYYSKTKNYTSYKSMKECIKSGGRKSKK